MLVYVCGSDKKTETVDILSIVLRWSQFFVCAEMSDRTTMFCPQIYQSSKPLRIGYLECDGYTQPSPSMARGVREVKALLEQAGHTVRPHTHTHSQYDLWPRNVGDSSYMFFRLCLQLVPYSPVKIAYGANELIIRGVFSDGGFSLLQKL